MENKKKYNNLYESIIMTILFVLIVLMYIFMISQVIFNYVDPIQRNGLIIFANTFWLLLIIMGFVLIITSCFSYYTLSNNVITYKKPFRKKILINFDNVIKVETKEVKFLLFSYNVRMILPIKGIGHVISDDKNKIIIIKKEKVDSNLERLIFNFKNKKL